MSLDHLKRPLTAAYCSQCEHSGHLSTFEGGYWCGWCGKPAAIRLRNVDVLEYETAMAHVVDGRLLDPEHIPLQPLRITAGWTVQYNNGFYDVDPTPSTIPWWWIFKQDMLTLVHRQRNRLLDLGWSPEMDVEEGCYRLVLYEGDFGGTVLRELETRDRAALVAEIEFILMRVTNGAL